MSQLAPKQTKKMHKNFFVSNNILPKFNENSSYKSKICLTYFWCFFNQRYNFDISEKKEIFLPSHLKCQKKVAEAVFDYRDWSDKIILDCPFWIFDMFWIFLFFFFLTLSLFSFLFLFPFSYSLKLFRSFVYILETRNAIKFRWVKIFTFSLWKVNNYIRKGQEGN